MKIRATMTPATGTKTQEEAPHTISKGRQTLLFINTSNMNKLTFLLSFLFTSPTAAFSVGGGHGRTPTALAVAVSAESQLAQLAAMTTLSIDSGDLTVIREYADTGYITDATTNPLFVSQAGLSGDPVYAQMVNDAVAYARQEQPGSDDDDETISLAIDRLAVNLGKAISDIVPGYISTEVDPRLSFDTEASVARGRRIIRMYDSLGVPPERILIKLAATWEGIRAAEILEKEGIQCNLTLIFSMVQAIACAQHGAHLMYVSAFRRPKYPAATVWIPLSHLLSASSCIYGSSPFPGRILDWQKVKDGRTGATEPDEDEGVVACRAMFNYYKHHGHDTICMPASWRPSRGPGYELDEILALAGSDRMTIPAPLLEKLAASEEPLEQKLSTDAVTPVDLVGDGKMTEKEFRYRLNMDGCGTDKLAEGIRAFVGETEKLEQVLREKVQAMVSA
jgi:transaldolase